MGFDNECILNIQSLAGEYFCPVCRLLVYPNEALQSQCTHLYCKPCLTYIVGTTRACPYDGYLVTEVDSKPLIESNKALAETIGKIAVHCLYHRSGCTWQGPLSECSSHCSGCAFGNSPVVCNRCGIQIVHRQVQEHAQNCPGMQPQAQQTQGVQDAAVTGTAAAADQSQSATLSATPTSQAQTLQTTAAPSAGHDPNQQTNANPQAQAVAPAAVPTPEQWYQQQYQQYYQQYPGYDPYQQTYQNYYPYQQQAIQQYQQHPQQVQVQPQPQVYAQPQPQPQHQPQPQPQSQPLPQPQPQPHLQPQQQVQPQSQSQPQPQPQPQVQPQPHQHFQAPVAAQHQNQGQVNPQQQLHPAVQPHAQMQTQTHPPPHGQPHPQQYPQAQPHPQQHVQQMPQYQLPNSQMQPPQPQVQLHPHSAVHSQPHSLPQSQPPSHSQAQPQALLQHHPHPQLHPPQPSQPPNLNTQTQTQHPSGPAVTGHHSFPQPQALSQMQSGAPQQHPAHILPQSGPLPQHPTQIHSQFPQQPPQMRPPQSHAPVPNQQQPAFLPPQGQVPSIPSAQQQPIHPHAQQPGHSVHQRPVMQPIQSVPQQYVQQQPFPPQTSGTVQNQLHQQGHFVQQQLPMQSQSRPPGPPHSVQQNSHAYLQPQQNVAHGMQPHQSQNYVGRPMMPNHGAQSHSFPQSPGGFSGAAQVRPMQLGANQPSTSQNYLPRTNSQLQTSSEQLVQAGLTSNPTVFERQGDHTSEKSVAEREAGSPSQRTAKTDANVLFPTSALRADIVEVRTLKSETDGKSMDTEQNPVGGVDDNPSQVGTLAKDADSESQATENGSGEPAIKPMGKKECTESGLPSPGGKSIEIVVGEQKDAANVPKVDHSSVVDTSLQQTKSLDEQSGKMPKVAMDAGRLVSTGTDKGSQAVPPASAPIPDSFAQNVALQGNAQTPLTGRDPLQHGYQERNLSQSQLTPQGPGVDEFRGFPPHGQLPGKGFGHPAPIPLTDQGRHHQPPMQYGPSTQQHRPAAPSMLQSVPPPGPPHHAQVPGQPPTLLRPQGPGNIPQAGQPLNPPEHFQPPAKQPYGSFHPELSLGGIPGPGSSSSFGRGPSHFGPPQRSFELQSSAPQGHYNQGHVPPPHGGLPRISQGEPPVGGVPQGALPPGSSVLHGGIMGRAPPHGPEGQFGQQRPINPMETEIFPNQRSRHFDGRQHDSHLPGTLERGPFGQPPGIESNAMRMNGAPGLDSTSTLGFRDERFRPLTEEHLNPFPLDPAQRHDQGEFEEDLKQFPRHSHLDSEPVPKLGSYFSTSRPIDRGPHGFIADATSRPLDKPPLGLSYDAGMKLDPVSGGAPSRFLPPYHGILHPNDTGERSHLVGPDDIGRADISRTRTDFPGPIAGFGRHHMDHRSPGRENPGVPTRGFGGLSGGPRNQSGLDDIDGRESRPFSEGSRSVNLPSDPVGNSFFESRFPVLPSHLRRGELDGPGNFRGGDLIGQDSLPSHFRRGELLGPRNLPGHLRMGEPTGFGAFPGHGRMGELAGPGNFPHHLPLGESFGSKSSHPQLGEPGFRSSYSLQGFPNDGGFYKGGMDSFGNSRKRKPVSMGWCRICKVDCETVEGLDLHSQTREHQNKTMDMVRSIKQQNAKKQKTSNVHASLEEAGKSRSAGHEGRGNKA